MNPLTPKFPHLIHGADYNPEQWLRYPEILKQDIELMKAAHMNAVSVGIFSWAHLEPREGVYEFDWLEEIINTLYENGIYTVLATPSGAKPLWMSESHEEIRRVAKNGVRERSGQRHNHCYTSPYYREKVREMDTRLAKRFSHHPGVILWHLSNEYGGECYCPLCVSAFREWLRERYGTLEELNHAWWTDFWSHTYTDWEQINPPFSDGESSIHGLNLDWRRFVTHQTVDFMNLEIAAVKGENPEIPCTANLMGFYDGLDYNKFSHLDVVSWDNYPLWHHGDNVEVAQSSACAHDLMRGIKRENFLLMENSPSCTNWTPVSKLKRDGMHEASAMQALAHGSESVQYFQFRKSRGSVEKFHGAVVDHVGTGDTRVFREVARVGEALEALDERLYGTEVRAQVAILYDWENRWAVENAAGPRNTGIHYVETVLRHHRAFWSKGIQVDLVDMEKSLDRYKLVVAPMLYLFRAGIQERLREFVEKGGTLVMTMHSGIVDETDLCFLGGWPGGMMDVFGIWNEAIDGLWDEDRNTIRMEEGAPFAGEYQVAELCGIVHSRGARVLAAYGGDFYQGTPALTVNPYGSGKAYYMAAQAEQSFLDAFYETVARDCGVERALDISFPYGVTAHRRSGGEDLIFLENYSGKEQLVHLGRDYRDVQTGLALNLIKLLPYQVVVLSELTKN